MAYLNSGPIVFVPNDVLDSPNGAVTNADFDVLDAEFELQFDTTYQSFYCYIGTVAGPDVTILRIQHDGTNFLFTMTAKDDYADTIHFSNSAGAKALNTYGTVRITHDINNLYSVYLDAVLIDSATIATLDMGDGVFHFGYFGSGTATVQNVDVSGAGSNTAPVIDTPEADIVETAGAAWTRDISDNSSDADLDTITYSVSPALPTGITLNTTTGVITATTSTVAQVPTNYTFTHSDGTASVDDIVSIHITGILSVGGDNEMDNNETDVLITTTGLPSSVTTFTSVKVDNVVMDNPRWNSGQPLFDAPNGMALGSNLVVEIEFTV